MDLPRVLTWERGLCHVSKECEREKERERIGGRERKTERRKSK